MNMLPLTTCCLVLLFCSLSRATLRGGKEIHRTARSCLAFLEKLSILIFLHNLTRDVFGYSKAWVETVSNILGIDGTQTGVAHAHSFAPYRLWLNELGILHGYHAHDNNAITRVLAHNIRPTLATYMWKRTTVSYKIAQAKTTNTSRINRS